uniref:Uncharacterized protein n=1 Tax=Octopus bimaculoides TaxID=37653 RepID=A0A0L8GUB5_OCTBM
MGHFHCLVRQWGISTVWYGNGAFPLYGKASGHFHSMVRHQGISTLWYGIRAFPLSGTASGHFHCLVRHQGISTVWYGIRAFPLSGMASWHFHSLVLFLAYFLAVIWVAASSLAVMPLLVSTFILSTDFKKGDCIELKYYGLNKTICEPELEMFLKDGKELFTCYIFTYVSAVLVTISMIHFLIAVSANYTHLKDSRFATYNAYETEDVRNSKHSILDTNM